MANNKLSQEKSRYLLQHKNNPVNWLPWSEEVFERAKKENKPILLSIGYSSCHWCHVMAKESFNDEEIANILNKKFIVIKIDKEEYPDIDAFYMNFLVKSTGSGGWPLNLFVNENKAPFYAFTYLPKEHFKETLKNIAKNYNEDIKTIQFKNNFKLEKAENTKQLLKEIKFPPEYVYGPQFPKALFLMLKMQKDMDVKKELEDHITKGLFDHIEGGFFRYTTDSEWKIPHFEKMLYDQATLLLMSAIAYKKYPKLCSYAINKTFEWLQNHMLLETRLYGSATDADTKQGEGFYYTIEETSDEDARKLFNLNEAGLHENRYVPWINLEMYGTQKSKEIMSSYKKERAKLDKPKLDEKSVMSWNCFLGYALVKCAEATNNENIKEAAEKLFKAIKKYHINDKFHHVVYDKQGKDQQEYLEDYSSYLLFLFEMARSNLELKKEIIIVIEMIKKKFVFNEQLFNTTERQFENLQLWQDLPFPSGGSMLLLALKNIKSEDVNYFIEISSGIFPLAVQNPSFFALWLYSGNLIYFNYLQ